jgi:hypothetical protein
METTFDKFINNDPHEREQFESEFILDYKTLNLITRTFSTVSTGLVVAFATINGYFPRVS